MQPMPSTGGVEKFELDDDVFFSTGKNQTYYGTIIKIVNEGQYARVRLFNSERRFLVRFDALKKMILDTESHP